MTGTIHAGRAQQNKLLAQHMADTGYVNSKLFVDSRQSMGLSRSVRPAATISQAQTGTGFAAAEFVIDWAAQQATCPTGKTSASWTPAIDRFKNHVIKIKFGKTDCRMCPASALCTRSHPPRRTITIRPQAQHEALLAECQREQTEQFAKQHAVRAGVAETMAEGVPSCGLRRSRYIGLARTHLQHLMTAAAINLERLMRWLAGEPKAATPGSCAGYTFLRADFSRESAVIHSPVTPKSTTLWTHSQL